jgi:hypothetical protein
VPVETSNSTINFNLSITSKTSPVYIYDISPPNTSSLPVVNGIHLLSMDNLTYFNKTLYPYNYRILQVNPGENVTVNLTLFINSSQFSKMETSIPPKGEIYPYVIEIIAETSSGAAVIGFTILKV